MKVLMFGPDRLGGILSVERLIMAQLDVEWVPTVHEGARLRQVLAYLRAVARLLRPGREVVHIHFSSHGSALRKALLCALARLTGRRVILHAHGSRFKDFFAALPGPLKWLLAAVLGGADQLIALSASWETYYQEAFGVRRTVVLKNPVALPAMVPDRRGRDGVRIVFLGRIGERKGAFELIRAFARLPGAARLDLAGDGDHAQARALATELGVADRVHVHGWVDPAGLLAEADVFALPSHNEGLPMAMLEAMGWGLPVVVTPVGGIPELVVHGENGWLVKPGDVDGLAEALAMDEPTRLKLGAAGRRAVEGLGAEAYGQALARLYERTSSPISGEVAEPEGAWRTAVAPSALTGTSPARGEEVMEMHS